MSEEIGEAAKKAGIAVAKGTLGVVESSGEIIGYAGKTASSGVQIVSATVGAIATTASRIQNSTEQMALRRAEIEKEKTAAQKGKSATQIAQIEADTKLELEQIQQKYEEEQARLKLDQEINLDKINSEQREKLLNQRETTNQRQLASNYGFRNNNPKPTDTGFKQTVNPFSKLCFSYIPQYFVTEDGTIIDIDFPEIQPTGPRMSIITVINKDTRQEIQITFQARAQKDWRGNSYYLQVPVIKFQDADGQTKTVFGKMYYNLIWFPCGTIGGRTKNNRKTNRRNKRTNKKSNRRRKTYRRRR